MKTFILTSCMPFVLAIGFAAQVPVATQIQIIKAEDSRLYDQKLEALMRSPSAAVRERAALAAGRIGDSKAVPLLIRMLQNDSSTSVRQMAAFALGEIESIDAADAIRIAIGETGKPLMPGTIQTSDRGRLAEAAGKIVAANAKDAKAPDLGRAIIFTLEAENHKASGHDKETVLLALTAALRARPENADAAVRKFLVYTDPDVVATALNTLTRLRAKNANRDARDLLATHTNAIVRANAARLLGASEDKESLDILIKAATNDTDPRVRVSAIRSLGALKDTKASEPLLAHGEKLLANYKAAKKPNFIPSEQSEFIEVASALGTILADTANQRAIQLLLEFAELDKLRSPEVMVAMMRIDPGNIVGTSFPPTRNPTQGDWRSMSSVAQAFGGYADLEPKDEKAKEWKQRAPEVLSMLLAFYELTMAAQDPKAKIQITKAPPDVTKAIPDVLRAFAKFKTTGLGETLLDALRSNKDVFVRAAAAELIADLPASKENVEALKLAYARAILTDLRDNDAQLAILTALAKLDKEAAVEVFGLALASPDYVVRRHVAALIKQHDLGNRMPGFETKIEPVEKHQPRFNTKLGQVLNSDADYRRAASRKNGLVKAVLATEKGTFTIDLLPEDAPLAVDNFIKLANSKYFNGLEVHRVVPNFVMQDGDPRGDGNGGPGWSIRCEINMVPYERGAVGMALSGKDTGGSQWFVTHSPQPHLDGGYTVFGKVNDAGMKVVDNIVRGDRILSVKIVEGGPTRRTRRNRKR